MICIPSSLSPAKHGGLACASRSRVGKINIRHPPQSLPLSLSRAVAYSAADTYSGVACTQSDNHSLLIWIRHNVYPITSTTTAAATATVLCPFTGTPVIFAGNPNKGLLLSFGGASAKIRGFRRKGIRGRVASVRKVSFSCSAEKLLGENEGVGRGDAEAKETDCQWRRRNFIKNIGSNGSIKSPLRVRLEGNVWQRPYSWESRGRETERAHASLCTCAESRWLICYLSSSYGSLSLSTLSLPHSRSRSCSRTLLTTLTRSATKLTQLVLPVIEQMFSLSLSLSASYPLCETPSEDSVPLPHMSGRYTRKSLLSRLPSFVFPRRRWSSFSPREVENFSPSAIFTRAFQFFIL